MATTTVTIDITGNCSIGTLATWVIDAIRANRPCTFSVETMAGMLQEWAEQALLSLIDTPDEWVKHALFIRSGVYNHVNLYAADWLAGIESYVTANS